MRERAAIITPVLIGGSIVILISFAIRASFGVFQIPVAAEFGWPRAYFSLAIAIQNLAWGVGQPIFGAIAERWGDRKAIILGAVLYAAGLLLSALAVTPGAHQWLAVLTGFGIAGTGFGVILALVGRAAAEEHRSLTLGIVTAAGSAGQILGAPLAAWLLGSYPWQTVFAVFAAMILASLVVLPLLRAPLPPPRQAGEAGMAEVVARAIRDPSFILIFLGFFSCGYQLGFVTAHFPAFVTELCAPIMPGSWLNSLGISSTSALGAAAIAVIGIMNVAGTIYAGVLGKHYSKKYLLSGIYVARTIVSAAFILAPVTPGSVLVFSAIMGALWLATVPLTAGLVGQIYGMRFMGTLYGLVFFSHQLGSFMGVWLGGELYDLYGNYTLVWWIGVGVGAFSALVHLPINERPRPAVLAMA